jgi:fatty-acyl-CoA synthase
MTVPREDTQAKLDRLAAATLQHTPSQRYTVGDRIEEKAHAHPDRPFILYGERLLSYGAFNAAANRVAHALHARGLATGDVAALLMENRPEFIVTWAGLAKLGVTVALLNTNLRGALLGHALETTSARSLIAGSECLEALASAGGEATANRPLFVYADPDSLGQPGIAASLAGRQTHDLDALLARMPADDPDPAPSAPRWLPATTSFTSSPRARPVSPKLPASPTCATSASATGCRLSPDTVPTT